MDPPDLAGPPPLNALDLAFDKYSERTDHHAIGFEAEGRVRAVEIRPNGPAGWGLCGTISEQTLTSERRRKVFLVLKDSEVVAEYRDDDPEKGKRKLARQGCRLLTKPTGASTVAALPVPRDAGPAPKDALQAAKAHYLGQQYLHVQLQFKGVRGRVKAIQVKPNGEFGWGICAATSWTHYVDGGARLVPYSWDQTDLLVWREGQVVEAFSVHAFDDLKREVAQDGCRYLSQH
ncbi:MAG TPA: hypothetical protein VFU71_12295 [Burkholderiaceae bacterium]|nr:hypothetical protein [Burkholderiaceae bacterium]